MAWEIGNGNCSLCPLRRWFGSIHWGSDHIVSPSDGCASDLCEADWWFQAHGEAGTSQHPGSQLAEICEDYTDTILFSLCFSEIHIVKILLAVK